MRRQLSSSSTRSLSWPQVLLLRCRIPSSVMSSQWDRLWKGKEQMFARPSHSKVMASEKQGSWPVQYPRAPDYEQEGQTQSLGALQPWVCCSWAVVSLALLTKNGNQNCRGWSGSGWQHKRILNSSSAMNTQSTAAYRTNSSGGVGCTTPTRCASERRPTSKQ